MFYPSCLIVFVFPVKKGLNKLLNNFHFAKSKIFLQAAFLTEILDMLTFMYLVTVFLTLFI